MRNNADILNEILVKYKLVSYVPENIQQRISNTLKPSLIRLYKSQRKYSRIYILFIAFFLLLRKAGLKMTIIQAKILFAVSSAVIITSGGSAGYVAVKYTVKKYHEKKNIHVQIDESRAIETKVIQPVKSTPRKVSDNIKFRLGVQPFSISGVIEDVNGIIIGSLKDGLGKEHVIDLGNVKNRNVNLMLFGSLRKMGGSYILSYKLVDVKTSMSLFVESERIDDINGIEFACRNMTDKIREHIRDN